MTFSRRTIERNVEAAMALTRDEFARRLRHARELKGLNQADVANGVNVDIRTYQRWESQNPDDQRMPYKKHLPRLAEVLDVEVEHLTGPLSTGDQLTRIENALNENNRLIRQMLSLIAGLEAATALPATATHEAPTGALARELQDGTPSRQAPQRARRRAGQGGT